MNAALWMIFGPLTSVCLPSPSSHKSIFPIANHTMYLAKKKWTRVQDNADLPPRYGHSAVTSKDSMFIIGGCAGPTLYSDIHQFHFGTLPPPHFLLGIKISYKCRKREVVQVEHNGQPAYGKLLQGCRILWWGSVIYLWRLRTQEPIAQRRKWE